MKPIAVLQFVGCDGPAFFARCLHERGVPLEVVRLDAGAPAPRNLDAHGALALLGGPMSANDDWDALRASEALVREALHAGIPVIGHCLGGQLMSRALGGRVSRTAHVEIGWSRLRAIDPALTTEWFGATEFPMFQWHNETFTRPAGARPLATGNWCVEQACVIDDRHVAMQFHSELDLDQLRTWLDDDGQAEIARESGSPAVQSAAAILAEAGEVLDAAQRAAACLYERWLQGLAR